MKSRLFLLIEVLLLAGSLYAQTEVWEGNAAAVSEGVFEEEGLFAASNAFALNAVITVENARTGKSVDVTVVRKIEGNPNIFLLLSPRAAEALDFGSGDVERVRANVPMSALAGIPVGAEELSPNRDPDINPMAQPPSLEEASRPAEEMPSYEPAEPSGAPAEAPIEEPVIPVVEESPEAEEKETPKSEAEELAARAATRSPQKDLYQTPKEVKAPEVQESAEEISPTEKEEPEADRGGLAVTEEPAVPIGEISGPEPEAPERDAVAVVSAQEPEAPEIPAEESEAAEEEAEAPVPAEGPVVENPAPAAPEYASPTLALETEPKVPAGEVAGEEPDIPPREMISAIIPLEPELPESPEDAAETEAPEKPVEAIPPVEEGPMPSIAPPPADRAELAFSEIKPLPPDKEEEERPTASLERPEALESRSVFSAIIPEEPRGEPSGDVPRIEEQPLLAFTELTPEVEKDEPPPEAESVEPRISVEAAAGTPATRLTPEIEEPEPIVTEAPRYAEPVSGGAAQLEPESPLIAATPDRGSTPTSSEDALLYLVPPEYIVDADPDSFLPEIPPDSDFLMAEAPVEAETPVEVETPAEMSEVAVVEEIPETPAEAVVLEAVDEYSVPVPEAEKNEFALETAEMESPVVTSAVEREGDRRLVLVPTEPKPPVDEPIDAGRPAVEDAERETAVEEAAEKAEPALTAEATVVPEKSKPTAEEPAEVAALISATFPLDRKQGRTYFIQLGAYGSEGFAQSVQDKYAVRYPVAVLATATSRGDMYRVLVGPLNEDESGTLLYWFQGRGFSDAFLRSAN